MSNVFWNEATPTVAPGDLPRAFLAARLAGAAPDGSQDTFAQIPAPSAVNVTAALLYAVLSSLPDIANGDPMPIAGLYLNAGALCIA